MNNIKETIYNTIDGFNLEDRHFKTLGTVMFVYSIICVFILAIALIGTIFLTSLFNGFLNEAGLESFGGFGGFARAIIFIITIPIYIIAGINIFVIFKAGIIAKNNWDKPENSELVSKWSRYYIIISIIGIIISLFRLNRYSLISIIINIIFAALYFYFTEKLSRKNEIV